MRILEFEGTGRVGFSLIEFWKLARGNEVFSLESERNSMKSERIYLESERFSLKLKVFSMELHRFSLKLGGFSWVPERFTLKLESFSSEPERFSLKLGRYSFVIGIISFVPGIIYLKSVLKGQEVLQEWRGGHAKFLPLICNNSKWIFKYIQILPDGQCLKKEFAIIPSMLFIEFRHLRW